MVDKCMSDNLEVLDNWHINYPKKINRFFWSV